MMFLESYEVSSLKNLASRRVEAMYYLTKTVDHLASLPPTRLIYVNIGRSEAVPLVGRIQCSRIMAFGKLDTTNMDLMRLPPTLEIHTTPNSRRANSTCYDVLVGCYIHHYVCG